MATNPDFKEIVSVLTKNFPNMEGAVIFCRDPVSNQLVASPLFQNVNTIAELIKRLAEYGDGLTYMSKDMTKRTIDHTRGN